MTLHIYSGALKTLKLRIDSLHFPDNILKYIYELKIYISIKISLKFVPRDPTDNIPDDKPLSELMTVTSTDAYMRHSTSMSQREP